MNLVMFCAIERIQGGFKVRFVRNGIFKIRKFSSVTRAIDWVVESFGVAKDEILLSITKY
jgi:hypothetical protein